MAIENSQTLVNESTGCRLLVADDSMQAWIRIEGPTEPSSLTSLEISTVLKDAKIDVNEAVLARIKEFVSAAATDEGCPEEFLVAEGRPAVEGTDGDCVWHESLENKHKEWQGDAPTDYYSFNSIITVDKDEPIGTLVRAVSGSDGVDVFGKTLPQKTCPKGIELDTTVRLSDDDSATLVANCTGRVVYEGRKLSLSEVFDVPKDVDFETGNIDSHIDVHIGGTILDRFAVKSEKGISVGGAIEGATVEAKGDVIVRGGIIQREKGSISSGGDIVAKFCDGAQLRAEGNVKVAQELMDSRVHCMEKLLVHGAVIGGSIHARQGAEVTELGNAANLATAISVGVDPEVLHEIDQFHKSLKTKRMAVERIRNAVQPMLADVKHLSPAQKERATELAFQVDEAEEEIAEAETAHAELLERSRATEIPYVHVSKVLHAGVTIRVGHRETMFSTDIKGPVRIEKRTVKNATEFVAINQLSGSIGVLPSNFVGGQSNDAKA